MKIFKVTALAGAALLFVAAPTLSDAAAVGGWSHGKFTQWHPHSHNRQIGAVGTQCFFCKPDSSDQDKDGVQDEQDQCPDTPQGVTVNSRGCPLDSDGDGVYDDQDRCPNTPKGAMVTTQGCWHVSNLYFNLNDASLRIDPETQKPESSAGLQDTVSVLKQNRALKVDIQGHTDNTGTPAYNKALSLKRAMTVKNYCVAHGVDAGRLTTSGFGLEKPLADNKTKEGRAMNRRVELIIK